MDTPPKIFYLQTNLSYPNFSVTEKAKETKKILEQKEIQKAEIIKQKSKKFTRNFTIKVSEDDNH